MRGGGPEYTANPNGISSDPLNQGLNIVISFSERLSDGPIASLFSARGSFSSDFPPRPPIPIWSISPSTRRRAVRLFGRLFTLLLSPFLIPPL